MSVRIIFLTIVTLLLAATSINANIIITGTRIVYPSSNKDVSVKMSNPGPQPALAQVWIDNKEKSSLDTADAPFIIMPPIFKIDPNKAQTIRIFYTGNTLPQDKESLFWFNLLDIPPLPNNVEKNTPQNYLQIAIRSKIKLFYRPENLPGSSDEAADRVNWQLIPVSNGFVLRGNNTSAYHISFNYVTVVVMGKEYKSRGKMIAPYSTEDFHLENFINAPTASITIKYEAINDHGGLMAYTKKLQP